MIMISIILFILIVSSVVVWQFTGLSGKKHNTEEQIAIAVSKGVITHFFVSRYFITPPELNYSFSDVTVELIKEESKTQEGEYEVSGYIEVINSETEVKESYEFKEKVFYFNGAYIGSSPQIEAIDDSD